MRIHPVYRGPTNQFKSFHPVVLYDVRRMHMRREGVRFEKDRGSASFAS